MTPKGRNRLIHDDDRLFMVRGVIRIVWKKMYYEVRNWLETTSFVPRCCRGTSIVPRISSLCVLSNYNKLKHTGGLVISGNIRLFYTVLYINRAPCTFIVDFGGEVDDIRTTLLQVNMTCQFGTASNIHISLVLDLSDFVTKY